MTTVEFKANKAKLAWQIAKQTKAPACIEGVSCTLEEVKLEIAEFEAELDAGTLETIPHKQVMENIRKLIANL